MTETCSQVVRELLGAAYTDSEISTLASDLFPSVKSDFSAGMEGSKKIEMIVDRAIKHGRLDDLFNYINDPNSSKANTHQFGQFKERLSVCPDSPSLRLNSINVHLVVAAMNRSQAKELLDGQVGDAELFDTFKRAYADDEVEQWSGHYGEEAIQWRPQPFSQAGKMLPEGDPTVPQTVPQLWHALVEGANDWRTRRGFPQLSLGSPMSFHLDNRLRDQESELENEHYILVVDRVSLFHPAIWEKLRTSSLVHPKEGSSVLVVTPTTSMFLESNRLLMDALESELRSIYQRHVVQLDQCCEIGVKNWRDIQRWLFMALSFSGDSGARFPGNDWKVIVRDRLGEQKTSVGSYITEGR